MSGTPIFHLKSLRYPDPDVTLRGKSHDVYHELVIYFCSDLDLKHLEISFATCERSIRSKEVTSIASIYKTSCSGELFGCENMVALVRRIEFSGLPLGVLDTPSCLEANLTVNSNRH